VRGVLTSGAQVEVLSAAAGTGKSFVVGALAQGWASTGHRVFGLAPSQIAAGVLAQEGVPAVNTTRWLATQQRLDKPPGGGDPGGDEQWRLRRGDLVVLDEAAMTSTDHIAQIRDRCAAAGAKLLLVGDPRQLAAVGPGGSMADIAAHGVRYELTEVRRFSHEWERSASLGLRDADPAVLDDYQRRGRLVDGGTTERAEAAAARAWLGDTLAGRDSLLLVGSNEQAARVSAQLRDELVALGKVEQGGVPLAAAGTLAGVGDLVQTRRNAWDLIDAHGHAVANRDVWRVIGRDGAGGLHVQLVGSDLEVRLPPRYVAEHVALAYASTVHAAQGRTVDTTHAVAGPGTSADALYVEMTRGRDRNTAYVVTRSVAPDAPTGQTLDVHERGARAVLTDVLGAEREERSALAQAEQAELDARSTATHIGQLIDQAEQVTAGRTAAILDRLATTEVITARQRAELAADNSMWSLEQLLRTAELAGHNPTEVLEAAAAQRSLDGARHPAEVLHARIADGLHGRLTPTITSATDLIPRDIPEETRQWFQDRADAADDRRRELGAELAAEPPQWALDALGAVPADAVAAAEWETKAGHAAAYRELVGHGDELDPLGAAPVAGLTEKAALFRGAHDQLGLIDVGAEEADLSEGRLRNRVAAAQRELVWAPLAVGRELDDTHQQAERERANAAIWAARAATSPDPVLAQQLRDAAGQAARDAAALTERAEQLERADQARAAWLAHTVVTRDNAERAAGELRARGVDVNDHSDHVTGDEWLTAHRTEQQAEDVDREIRDEHDFHDGDQQGTRTVGTFTDRTRDEQATDTVGPDIRDTAEADPSEQTDTPRRSPRAPDETAAIVARATEAVAEIAERDRADQARAAQDAQQETARREKLTRWAADDRAAEQHAAAARDDDLVMER